MAIEDLIRSLEEDARRKAASVLREARAEAARSRREAEEEVARRVERFLAERERKLREDLAAELAGARRDARARVLEARAELLDRVFRAAGERLPAAADTSAYRESLPSRLGAAIRYVDPDEAVVRCPPALEGAVREALEEAGAGATARIETDPEMPAGFAVVREDGSVRVDDTLVRRLERGRETLAIAVVERVEGEGSERAPGRGGGGACTGAT